MEEEIPDDVKSLDRYKRWSDIDIPNHWKRWQEGTGFMSWHGRCLLCDPTESGSTERGNYEFQVLERLLIHKCIVDRGDRIRAGVARAAWIGVVAIIAAVFLYFFVDWDGSDTCPPGEEVIDVIYGDGLGPDQTVCG